MHRELPFEGVFAQFRNVLRRYGTIVALNLGIEAAAEQLGDTVETAREHFLEPTYRGPEEVAHLFA